MEFLIGRMKKKFKIPRKIKVELQFFRSTRASRSPKTRRRVVTLIALIIVVTHEKRVYRNGVPFRTLRNSQKKRKKSHRDTVSYHCVTASYLRVTCHVLRQVQVIRRVTNVSRSVIIVSQLVMKKNLKELGAFAEKLKKKVKDRREKG